MHAEIRRARSWRGRPRFYARIIADNGQTLFTSETYNDKRDAERAVHLVTVAARTMRVRDLS